MRYIFALLISFTSLVAAAQCFTGNQVFKEGEEISYTVSYNWGPVWVDAGLVTFSVAVETLNGKPAWHLKSTGKTFASYDLLFKVRDYYDSWLDPETFKSLGFKRYIYEGGYTLLNTLHFDHQNGRLISNTRTNQNPQRTDTVMLKPCAFDMLSAVYFTRTLDLARLPANGTSQVLTFIDDAYYPIVIRSLGREVVENTDGKRYRCIKFAAKMVQGTIFRGDEDVLVWVTDDDNRIPVYIEAKIIVGTVKAYLKTTKGLRNPVKSLVP